MKSSISTPVAVIIIVIAVIIVGFAGWKYLAPESVPRDAKGNPTQVGPKEAQPGVQAMQGLFKQGVMPRQNAANAPSPQGR